MTVFSLVCEKTETWLFAALEGEEKGEKIYKSGELCNELRDGLKQGRDKILYSATLDPYTCCNVGKMLKYIVQSSRKDKRRRWSVRKPVSSRETSRPRLRDCLTSVGRECAHEYVVCHSRDWPHLKDPLAVWPCLARLLLCLGQCVPHCYFAPPLR